MHVLGLMHLHMLWYISLRTSVGDSRAARPPHLSWNPLYLPTFVHICLGISLITEAMNSPFVTCLATEKARDWRSNA